jgi:hypothetical protein
MMGKRKKRKKNSRLLVALAVLLSCSITPPWKAENEDLRLKLKASIDDCRAARCEHIDLSDVVPQGWDKLTILTPYTEEEKIESILGFSWPQSNNLGISKTESFNVLIFSRNDTVVEWFKFYRSDGDFARITRFSYSPQHATFSVRVDSSNSPPWLYLETP